MDPTKPSLSSKSTNINNGAGQNDVAPLEEAAEQWREGGGEVERPREVEREAKVTNGVTPAAETASQHQGAADKHRSNTISYQRRTKQKVVTDFATVSKGMSASAKPRGALRQVLFNQGVSDKGPVPEGRLVEVDIRGLERGQLDALKQALEAFPVPVSLRWSWGEEGTGATLEDSWTDIVHSHTTMCKTQKHQQEALWEFVHTELTYINKLTIVTDLVMSSLTNLHQHGFLQEVTSEQIFSNLPSILTAHQLFWREVMYPMLQEVRRTGKPFDPLRLEAGCLQFHERFSTYLQYCWEEENTVEFTHRLLDTNLHFHTYMQWVETHPQCERMRLGDMQAKPHQRITKYPLLLKAVHKNTQDPHTEHTLRGMLTSVNGFLDGINDYLRLKDEELALSISAQRVEGYYATDGMNEEIDKHVREFCHFDLTRPIRGVGPGVIRKLLLEETLKIRCRKDSKLEVMALLFSDVLLVTKAQKKAERLKVVRPPLALDRTRCAVLKDGCSFVLVEVSDLGCAMNVYTFSTSSPENCSKWVSTIQEAQETLQALSRTETSRQLKANQRLSQSEAPPSSEPKVANEETVELPPDQSQVETLVASIATEADLQTHEPLKKKGCFFQGPQYKFSDTHSQLVNRTYSHWPIKNGREGKAMDGVKMSGVGVREYRDSNQWEENYGTEFLEINEQRATWNHSRHSVPDISNSYISTGNTASTFKPKHHSLLLGGYPDIDYPFTQSSTNLSPCRENHPEGSMGQSEFPGAVRTMRQDSDSQSVEQGARRDSWYSQSREEEALAEAQKFSRKLKSPRLRRRRPIHAQQDAPSEMLRRGSVDSGVAWSIPYTNSSSNSDSDCNQKLRGNSRSKGQSNDSHLVLKLGSLKMNRGVLWNISADPHTFSEPELPREVPDKKSQKRPKLKTQRSISIPDIIIQGGHGALLTPSRPSRAEIAPSPPPGLDRQLYPSPLEGLLERAKDRRRDRYGGKLEGREKTPNFQTTDLLHSPSVSTTLSQSPSKGDRETEWEEVQLFRCRASAVSEGWREAWVDGDEEKKTSFPFPDGASVDWPGWCFDDNEVMDRLTPEDSGGRDEGLWEGLSRSLTLRDVQQIAHQEDGQCSQV